MTDQPFPTSLTGIDDSDERVLEAQDPDIGGMSAPGREPFDRTSFVLTVVVENSDQRQKALKIIADTKRGT